MDKIVMYTDGGSRGNPGPAAIGVWIETLDKKYGECIGKKTNNEAEYEALIFGLKKIKALAGKGKIKKSQVVCFLDSELIVNQLSHKAKIESENTKKLFIEVWNLTIDWGNVAFFHVPREKNRIADKLVNAALDEKEGKNALF